MSKTTGLPLSEGCTGLFTDAKRQVCRSQHDVSGFQMNDKVDERDELNKSSTPKQIFEVGAGIMITKCN